MVSPSKKGEEEDENDEEEEEEELQDAHIRITSHVLLVMQMEK